MMIAIYYHPQTKFAKVMFLQVSVILSIGGGVGGGISCCSGGDMHGCSLGGGGGGGMHGCSRGMCMVAPGGMHGCSGGACMVFWGCMVFSGGHAWFFREGGVRVFFDEIQSISGQYASYWNAFLFFDVFHMFFNLSHFRIRFCFM